MQYRKECTEYDACRTVCIAEALIALGSDLKSLAASSERRSQPGTDSRKIYRTCQRWICC